jgi:cyclophilin family peptidyl-prolyl cis-trans isomerase
MKNFILVACCSLLLIHSGSLSAQNKGIMKTPGIVSIKTDFGTMKVRLYDETPLHKNNFLKLARQGFYDSTLFHRVIKEFMIQGGDPDSKNAAAGQALGNGDVGYTIPAEFNDALYHKKGALCAARTENPLKASSGCQFYIVQGKKFTDADLDQMEARINMQRKQALFGRMINDTANASIKARFVELQNSGNNDSLTLYINETIEPMIAKELKLFKYTQEQRDVYKNTGGTPHLDQGYTVFGEVVEGLDVLDKIAAVPTGKSDRPVNDLRMFVKVEE